MAQPVSPLSLSGASTLPPVFPLDKETGLPVLGFPSLLPEERSVLEEELTPLKDLLTPFQNLPLGMSLESMELVGGDAIYLLGKSGYLPRVIPDFPKLDLPSDRDVRIKIRYPGGRKRDLETLRALFGKADREVFIDTGFNTFCVLQFGRVELIMGFEFQRESLFKGEMGIPLLPLLESGQATIMPRGLDESTLDDIKTHWVERKLEATKPREINEWGFFRLISKMTKGWTSGKELLETLLEAAQLCWQSKGATRITHNIGHTLRHHHSDDSSAEKAYYFNFCILSRRTEIWKETFGVSSLPFEQLNALLSVIAALQDRSFVAMGKDHFHPTLSLEEALPILAENMTDELFYAFIELCPARPSSLQADPALLSHSSPYVRYLGALCNANRQRHLACHVLSVLEAGVAEKAVREKVEAILGEALPKSTCRLEWAKWMIHRDNSDEEVFAMWNEAPTDVSTTWTFALSYVNTKPRLVQRMVRALPNKKPEAQLGALLSLASKRLSDAPFVSALAQLAGKLLEQPFKSIEEAKLIEGTLKLAAHADSSTASPLLKKLGEKFSHVNALFTVVAALNGEEGVTIGEGVFRPTLPLEDALSLVKEIDDELMHSLMKLIVKYGTCDEAAIVMWKETRSNVKASWQFAARYVNTRSELVQELVLTLPEDEDPYLQLGGLLTVADKCSSNSAFISELAYQANLLLKQPFSCSRKQKDRLVTGIKKLVKLVNGSIGAQLLEALREKFSVDIASDLAEYHLRDAASSGQAVSVLKQHQKPLTDRQIDHLLELLEIDPESTLFAKLVERISPVDQERGKRLIGILKRISDPVEVNFTGFFYLSKELCQELLEVIIEHELSLPSSNEAAEFWVKGMKGETQWEAAKENGLTIYPCFIPKLLEVADKSPVAATDLMARDLSPEQKKTLNLQIEKLGMNFPGTAEEFFVFYKKVCAYDKIRATTLQSRAALYCMGMTHVRKDFPAGLAAITALMKTWEGDRSALQSLFAPIMHALIPVYPADCEGLMRTYLGDLPENSDIWITLLLARPKKVLFDWLEREQLLPIARRWEAWQMMVREFGAVYLVRNYAHAFKELEIGPPELGVLFHSMVVLKGCQENDPSLLPQLCIVQDDCLSRFSSQAFPLAGHLTREQISGSKGCFKYQPGLDVRKMDYPTLSAHLTSGTVQMIPATSEVTQHCVDATELALMTALLKASHPQAEKRLRRFLDTPQLASVWSQVATLIYRLALLEDLDDILKPLLTLAIQGGVKNLSLSAIIPLLLKRFSPEFVARVCLGSLKESPFPEWETLCTLFDALWHQEPTVPESNQDERTNITIALFNTLSAHYQDKIDANRHWHLDIYYYSSLATAHKLSKGSLETACEIFKSGITWYEDVRNERLAKGLMALCLSFARFGLGDPFSSGFIWLKGRLQPEHLEIWKEKFWEFSESYEGEDKEAIAQLKEDWGMRPRVREYEVSFPTPTNEGRHVVFVPMSAFKALGKAHLMPFPAETFE